ncbi:MAG: DUF805 domain-containing protein [Streptococcus sp.]|nr:DUF805 domain-containing protein [Streptococcus sp.]
MLTAYKKYWKHYVDFSGRSSRSEYWLAVLMNMIIIIVTMLVFILLFDIDEDIEATGEIILEVMFRLFVLANIIPFYAITIRRLRDADLHWTFIFLTFVPTIGLFIHEIAVLAKWVFLPCNIDLIILLCQKNRSVENNPSEFETLSVQGQQFGQAPQDFGQQPTQQNIQPTQEQQSSQPIDNRFETKD